MRTASIAEAQMRNGEGIFKNFNSALNKNPPKFKSDFRTNADFVAYMMHNQVVYIQDMDAMLLVATLEFSSFLQSPQLFQAIILSLKV